jgi:Tol biopolymer transport system component
MANKRINLISITANKLCAFFGSLMAFCSFFNASAGEHFVLSNGARIYLYELNNNEIRKVSDILSLTEWNAIRPSYNAIRDTILFEGRRYDDTFAWLFEIKGWRDKNRLRINRLIQGRMPSLSPDGKNIAYLNFDRDLVISAFQNLQKPIAIVENLRLFVPVIWLDESSIIFNDKDNNLVIFNVLSQTKRRLNARNLNPVAASKSRQQLLLVSNDGSKLVLIEPSTNLTKTLVRSKFLSIVASAVWLNDESGFLYSRQTWGNILTLSEVTSLFIHKIGKGEKEVLKKFSLFGGTSVTLD